MNLFRRLLAWLFPPVLKRLEREAGEIGTMTLQQFRNADGMSWMCSIRPTLESGYKGYAWTASADSIPEAIRDAIAQSKEYPVGGRPLLVNAPKLGGTEFDEE